ncbi:hypothetical protein HMPREF1376_02874 [Enterococcus faecium R446]|nr:hypothetical protein HMPREF1376_02874 [Enterococcus faecium R446]
MRNYFSICFSNTQVKTLISQPLDKWCSISCPSVLAQKTAKYEELFFHLFL